MKLDFEKSIKDGVEQAMKECELTIGMTLKEAVERQIPKKPNFNELDKTVYAVCPNCNYTLTYKDKVRANFWKLNYCFNCGQALDWSDTE